MVLEGKGVAIGPPTIHTLVVPGASLHVEVRGAGPALLLIAGGSTDAGVFDGVAHLLQGRYTVITYDPRGNSRSPLDGPPVDMHIEVLAEDAHRLLDRFSREPAFVFGSSSGALVALELLARHPEQTARVIAHEPPAVELLPDAATYRAFFDDVVDTYRRHGVGPAMRKFAATAGIDGPNLSRNRELPPAVAELMSRMARNNEFLLEHEMAQFARFVPDVAALQNVSGQLVLGVGEDSADKFPSMPASVLAEQLGLHVVRFPGGHMGYASSPVEFAARLAECL
jgi:pimeloyl-ACP methyl ester carboxylesterase